MRFAAMETTISKDIKIMAGLMRKQLDDSRLSVELSESYQTADNGRMIRVATDRNPEWYQRFCRTYSPSNRKRERARKHHDTYIKRSHTLRALNEIESGKCETDYAYRLLPVVKKEFSRMIEAVENGRFYFCF